MPDERNETHRHEASDGTALLVRRWLPEGEPGFALHVAHGMGEHSARYGRFAKAVCRAGGIVYAHDHRGHGESVTSPEGLGVLGADGWNQLVADLSAVHGAVRERHPGLPFVALGHSMGSFALQQLLLDESDRMTAAVLSGSAALDGALEGLDPDAPVDLSAFNAPFEPARTGFDWLSRDPAEVDAYVSDPLCGFGLAPESTRDFAAAVAGVADPERLAGIRGDLPLYVMAGDADPLNRGGTLLELLVDRYRKAGLGQVELRLYPDARHELLNETNRDVVTSELLDWLRAQLR